MDRDLPCGRDLPCPKALGTWSGKWIDQFISLVKVHRSPRSSPSWHAAAHPKNLLRYGPARTIDGFLNPKVNVTLNRDNLCGYFHEWCGRKACTDRKSTRLNSSH